MARPMTVLLLLSAFGFALLSGSFSVRAYAAECGDGQCDAEENCENCPQDCGCPEGQVCFQAECCAPQCEGKECGDDGCGGSCGECPQGLQCCDDGTCKQNCSCNPNCDGKVCGDDGCGGSCGQCDQGMVCQNGQCVECEPECEGKECGPDGCGGTCGECPEGMQCCNNHVCAQDCGSCEGFCGGQAPDGCWCDEQCQQFGDCCPDICDQCPQLVLCTCGNQTCDENEDCTSCPDDCPCSEGEICYQGNCCIPQCEDIECGEDSAGCYCGDCPQDQACFQNICVQKTPDSCIGNCGGFAGQCFCDETCLETGDCCQDFCQVCDPEGSLPCCNCKEGQVCFQAQCCSPQCEDKKCFEEDGCGGTCGCSQGLICCSNGECLEACPNSCQGLCGGQAELCYCDEACFIYGDCCDDVCSACPQLAGCKCGDGKCDYPENCETCPIDCGCGENKVCYQAACCSPSCENKECGSDGCGGTCGQCKSGEVCLDAECHQAEPCDDCAWWQLCVAGQCVDPEDLGDCPEGGYAVAQGCDVVQEVGCCAGDSLYYCASGIFCPKDLDSCTCKLDCAGLNSSCGWMEEFEFYGCVPEAGSVEDPSGENPLACPWICVPQCMDKECGDDGCGSVCGTCNQGQECIEGKCLEPCFDQCPPNSSGCEDDVTVWKCEMGEAGCLEKKFEPCPQDQICQSGQCIPFEPSPEIVELPDIVEPQASAKGGCTMNTQSPVRTGFVLLVLLLVISCIVGRGISRKQKKAG